MYERALALALLLIPVSYADEGKLAIGCTVLAEEIQRKEVIENNLLPKIRFIGEPERGNAVADRMDALKVPAISFALINEGKVKWTAGYGVKSSASDAPVTCESLFQAASLSKPLTLTAAVRMHEAGLIDMDVNIQSYLRDYRLPDGAHSTDNPITFRNILNHTSGLTPGGFPGYHRDSEFPSDIELLNGKGVSNSATIESLKPPGAELAYSGGGYTVAEVAMQDVTGDTFADLMDEWILHPLAMSRSEFTQPLPSVRFTEVARGHIANGKPLDSGWHNYPEQAAAGLWATAGDLATFIVEIYKAYHGRSEILDKETIRELIHDQRDGHAYGFLLSGGEQQAPTITHYGGNAGYRSFMFINLDTGDGAVYLTNSDGGGNLGSEFLYSASKVYGWRSYQQIEAIRSSRDVEELKFLVGVYAFDENLRVAIDYSDSESAIGVNFPNGDRYSLVPISGENEFIHPGSGVSVSFDLDGDFQTLTLYGSVARKVD